jgi:hypothetical protein
MTSGWLPLEGGIEVQLSEGTYKTGDSWLIPARTATAEIEWPPYTVPNINPIPQPPFGIQHHFCRLALSFVDKNKKFNRPSDCRALFRSVTDLTSRLGDREPGIHIKNVLLKNTNSLLLNDTDVSVDALASGIIVVCDEKISPMAVKGKPTCFVTLDLPFPFNRQDREFWGEAVIGFQPLILAADVSVEEDRIWWKPTKPTRETGDWLQKLFQQMKESKRGDRILAHLTLKGNFIWAQDNSSLYLDGEAFSEPRNRENTNTIYLGLPSGDGRRGGDFEMWFWLVKPIELTEVTLSQTKVEGGVTLQGRVTLSGPAPDGGAVVTLSSNKPTVATVPSNITVAAGSHTASFQVSTKQVNATTEVGITASQEQVNKTANLTVQGVQLLSLTLNADSVDSGNLLQGRVTLSGPASAGGAVVTLFSDKPAVATVPPNITVAAGLQTVSFNVSTIYQANNPNSTTNVKITASREDVNKIATLGVIGPKVN